jgi:serine/threonine-protein kinase RsbW
MKQKFELNTAATLENLPAMLEFVDSAMEQLGMPAADIPRVSLAADEALTNVIKHAYGSRGGDVTIGCERSGDDILITIRDRGRPFDPRTVQPPDLDADLENRRVGGLGIYLMKKLMDDVHYHFDAEQGNQLTMRKRVRAASGASGEPPRDG